MIRPDVLSSDRPYGPWGSRASDVWDTFVAAEAGDAPALRRLLAEDPNLARSQYWYTPPLRIAVREGHAEATKILLDAGGEPASLIGGDDLVTVARDRGHEEVARLLEDFRARPRPEATAEAGHPIHAAAAAGDAARLNALLDADPKLVDAIDAAGFQPIDYALWDGPFWGLRGDFETARLLLSRGAAYDLAIAAARGDLGRVRAALNEDARRINETRPSGKRPLSSAVEFGHHDIARMLLDRGADPNLPEGATAPRGAALHAAARAGSRSLVELLLAHGADPNGHIDSSGSATYAARTPELRALLFAHGGTLDAFDLVFLGEDDEVVRRVVADPAAAHSGCGGVFTAACKLGKRDLLVQLLDAGARVPPVLTACRSYLMNEPGMLRLLLASGMDPDLPNWQRATPLHDLCARDGRGRPQSHRVECAGILLDAGATISARDDEYRSTPLAWAARADLSDMVELLLARGAPASLPDDAPWATPLAWAEKRGHRRVADILRTAGAAG
jgi:ankyrin repeat protein